MYNKDTDALHSLEKSSHYSHSLWLKEKESTKYFVKQNIKYDLFQKQKCIINFNNTLKQINEVFIKLKT